MVNIISIIIPIYNVEGYLIECLESICTQYREGMQVICIDDCSTDNSYEILEECIAKYPFVEVYRNAVNKGLAATRNVGLSYADGEYVMFVDSDDFIADDGIDKLMVAIDGRKADIIHFDVQMFAEEDWQDETDMNRRIRKHNYSDSSGVGLMSELIGNGEMFGAVWGAIYRRSFLETINLRFIEGILHEDIPFMFKAMLEAEKAICVNMTIYYYRQRRESILHTPDYERLIQGLVVGYFNMLTAWNAYISNERYDGDTDLHIKRYLDLHIKAIEQLLESNNSIKNVAIQHFVERFSAIRKGDLLDYFDYEDILRIKKSKVVTVYGAGKIARKVIMLLRLNDIFPNRIVVTNLEDNPDELQGVPVEKYEGCRDSNECIVVAVSCNNQAEIEDKLKGMNMGIYVKTIAV